mmetsp:Transcript_105401/g.263788  ORF Transcript_105401/g.263788 Transcript_105401/m.263788 type:complete len:250 (+) Transcript_105401:416-1165(+)
MSICVRADLIVVALPYEAHRLLANYHGSASTARFEQFISISRQHAARVHLLPIQEHLMAELVQNLGSLCRKGCQLPHGALTITTGAVAAAQLAPSQGLRQLGIEEGDLDIVDLWFHRPSLGPERWHRVSGQQLPLTISRKAIDLHGLRDAADDSLHLLVKVWEVRDDTHMRVPCVDLLSKDICVPGLLWRVIPGWIGRSGTIVVHLLHVRGYGGHVDDQVVTLEQFVFASAHTIEDLLPLLICAEEPPI